MSSGSTWGPCLPSLRPVRPIGHPCRSICQGGAPRRRVSQQPQRHQTRWHVFRIHLGTMPTEFDARASHRAPLSLDLSRRGATTDNQSTAPNTPNKVACLPDPPGDHAYRVWGRCAPWGAVVARFVKKGRHGGQSVNHPEDVKQGGMSSRST
jgi:hypothetical protein